MFYIPDSILCFTTSKSSENNNKSAEILEFPNDSKSATVQQVLTVAKEASLEQAIVAGYDKDGNLFYRFANIDKASALWIIENLKKVMLE